MKSAAYDVVLSLIVLRQPCVQIVFVTPGMLNRKKVGRHGLTMKKKGKKKVMSYMRGDISVWRSDSGIHLWVTSDFDDEQEEAEDRDGYRAAKIRLPLETFDELVMMRLAQLTPQERAEASRRAIQKWGENFGCADLRREQKEANT